jgi:serine/threonine-protein kinase
LAQKARDLAASFGYPRKPADSEIWLTYRDPLIEHLKQQPQPRKWADWLASEGPIQLEYRESPSLLNAEPFGMVKPDNPAPVRPGMVHAIVDGSGRLRQFSAVPPSDNSAMPQPVTPEAVFRAAGLDMTAFTETTPDEAPPFAADQLRVWKGPHPAIPKTELTVAMGSWKGRLTFARVRFPWEKTNAAPTPPDTLLGNITFVIAAIAIFFAVLLARRNWKLGRADRKGALRLAAVRFVLAAAVWLGTVHGLPDGLGMVGLAFQSMGDWLLSAGFFWVFYLALEPELRARWPHSIVTWNRLLAGRWRDAQVGAHILIGAAVGVLIWMGAELIQISAKRDVLASQGGLERTLGTRHWLAGPAGNLTSGLIVGLILFFAVFGLRQLVRRNWLAAVLASALATVFNFAGNTPTDWQMEVPIFFALFAVLIFVLVRIGLVAAMASVFYLNSCGSIVVGSDWATWWAPYGVATLAMLIGIALVAFWRSLGSRELLGSTGPE